jgi:pectinesterase
VACSLCQRCTEPPGVNVPCLNASNPHFDCPAPCFCDTAVNATLLEPIANITFSAKYQLQLDLFLPTNDSPSRMRPAMVAVHGGGFSGGTRQSEAKWCRRLAARGYVCATVDYRLHQGINPSKDPLHYPGVILNATEDTRAAIRWLRANAEKYRIGAFPHPTPPRAAPPTPPPPAAQTHPTASINLPLLRGAA